MIFQKTDILERVKERPFKPFRIRMNSGRSHEIRHAENVFANSDVVFIAVPFSDDNLHFVRDIVKVSLAKIAEIETERQGDNVAA